MKRVYGDKESRSDIAQVTEFLTLFKIHQMNLRMTGKKRKFGKVRIALCNIDLLDRELI